MHRLPFVLLGLTACGSPTPTASVDPQSDPAALAVFTTMFDSNCGDCHWAPDPSYAVDRGWITQLADTA